MSASPLPGAPARPRILSVSLAPYDGYPVAEALASLARLGVRSVEPAFIVGYTEPFDESAFAPAEARRMAGLVVAAGLSCHAMSSHIDLGAPDAVTVFRGRMDYARAVGAEVIATNAAAAPRRDAFLRNLDPLLRHAEQLGLVIGLENPGDGRDNLFNTAADGLALVERVGSPYLRLNYDPANLASHAPAGPDPSGDAIRAIPGCAHMHVKDVRRTPEGWFFTPVGAGDLDGPPLFRALAARPDMPLSIELPLRLHRGPDAKPVRAPAPIPLDAIEAAVAASLATLKPFGLVPADVESPP